MKNFNDFLNSAQAMTKTEMGKVKDGGTCQVLFSDGSVAYGLSKDAALSYLGPHSNGPDGMRWCCDSCGSASWAV